MTARLLRFGIAPALLGVAFALPTAVESQPPGRSAPGTMAPVALAADAADDRSGTANLPPVCSGAAASEAVLWPPNHRYRTITIRGVTDPDGDPVTITVTGITQDEAA